MSSTSRLACNLYRGIHREILKDKKVGQGVSPDFQHMLRSSFAQEATVKKLHEAKEVLLFLQSQRKYSVCILEYFQRKGLMF